MQHDVEEAVVEVVGGRYDGAKLAVKVVPMGPDKLHVVGQVLTRRPSAPTQQNELLR